MHMGYKNDFLKKAKKTLVFPCIDSRSPGVRYAASLSKTTVQT